MVYAFALAAALAAAPLQGHYPLANPSGGRTHYDPGDHPAGTFVIFHFGVTEYCNGIFEGPTSSAPFLNQLALDYGVSATSAVQVLDVADFSEMRIFQWWTRTTRPNHPVVIDQERSLIAQFGGTFNWPEVAVVDCNGVVQHYSQGDLDQSAYRALRGVIDRTVRDVSCPAAPGA